MSDNKEEIRSSLKEVLLETMQATLEADADVAQRYYETLQQYAFEDKNCKEVKMARFEVPNANGIMQEISIPQLALMPLPILQVSEATFELNLEMMEEAPDEQVPMAAPTASQAPIAEKVNPDKNSNDTLKKYNTNSNEDIQSRIRNLQRQDAVRKGLVRSRFYINLPTRRTPVPMTTAPNVVTKKTDSVKHELGPKTNSTANLKVSIKMQQSDLPSGVSTLLQTIANGMQIKVKK